MYEGIGKGVDALFKMMLWLLIVFVPLGLWKLIEIIYWLYTHITIGWVA